MKRLMERYPRSTIYLLVVTTLTLIVQVWEVAR